MPRFFCDNCNKEVSSTDSLCPRCGRPFNDVLCPRCGFTGVPTLFSRGCPVCGYMSPPKNAPGISASPLAPARKNRTQPRLSPWVFLAAIAGLGLALAAFAYALMRR